MNVNDFKPLENNGEVANISDLSIENNEDSILVAGSIEFIRDKLSIDNAELLAGIFTNIANKLKEDLKNGLTTETSEEGAVTEISNPF